MLKSATPYMWVLLLLLSCTPDPVISDPEIPFTGVSLMDENGSPLASGDPTDWRIDDVWFPKEKALFPASAGLKNCPASSSIEAYPCMPNPGSRLYFGYRLPDSMELSLCIVDRNFSTLYRQDAIQFGLGYNAVILNLDSIPLRDTVRIYYQLQRRNATCVFRGHGDVILK